MLGQIFGRKRENYVFRSFIICILRQILGWKKWMVRWAVYVVLVGMYNIAYKILDRECEGKKTLGKTCSILEDNIKMDFK
jgi:hypothetical protein